jgi:succinyl-CoA synthetase alpha subunit
MKKSVLSYIASLTALRGRTMGHAGIIATTAGESAEERVEIQREAGVRIVMQPSESGNAVKEAMSRL